MLLRWFPQISSKNLSGLSMYILFLHVRRYDVYQQTFYSTPWPQNSFGSLGITKLLSCCKTKRHDSIVWYSNEENNDINAMHVVHCCGEQCILRPPLLPLLECLHDIRSANSCLKTCVCLLHRCCLGGIINVSAHLFPRPKKCRCSRRFGSIYAFTHAFAHSFPERRRDNNMANQSKVQLCLLDWSNMNCCWLPLHKNVCN